MDAQEGPEPNPEAAAGKIITEPKKTPAATVPKVIAHVNPCPLLKIQGFPVFWRFLTVVDAQEAGNMGPPDPVQVMLAPQCGHIPTF